MKNTFWSRHLILFGLAITFLYSCDKESVYPVDDFVSISAGGYHSLALTNNGTLWAWGENSNGELGNGKHGAAEDQNTPIRIGTGYMAVSAGGTRSFALKTDGSLWAWGFNGNGVLGDGTFEDRYKPIQIGSDYIAIDVCKGQYGFSGHCLALKTDGTLWSWGENSSGQLGDSTTVNKNTPIQIGSDFVTISAGFHHSLALKSDGSLWAWGKNASGQLGDGTNVNKETPVQIGSGYIAIAAGHIHSLALKTDGSLWAWGGNLHGELGDGTFTSKNSPEKIGIGYKAISSSDYHALALKTDGTLLAWGANDSGQVGDGTFGVGLKKNKPVQIGQDFSVISAGSFHSLGIKTDGTVWAWGSNAFGQLGDGTNGLDLKRSRPYRVGPS